MTVYLVRHGHAGQRSEWAQPDELRPLSRRGRAQAAGLVRALGEAPLDRVLSSRYLRCVQTVEPLAAHRGLAVEPHDALAEEADADAVMRLLADVASSDVVLCTHGNIVPLVLDHLQGHGVAFEREPTVWKKGSTWVLEGSDRRVRSARYLPPLRG